MKNTYPSPAQSTPLPSDPTWLKKFNAAVGDPDKKVQDQLAKSMKLNYRSGVGELIWAMTSLLMQPHMGSLVCNDFAIIAAPPELWYY